MKTVLVQADSRVAAAIKTTLLREHRLAVFQNKSGLIRWTEEARVAVILPLADAMKTQDLLDLTKSLEEAMAGVWLDRGIQISDGVEVLRALERASWGPLRTPLLSSKGSNC